MIDLFLLKKNRPKIIGVKCVRKKENWISFSLIFILSSLLLMGCWDRREINDVAFVLTSGFDLTADNKYEISIVLPLTSQESVKQKGSSGGKSFYVDTQIENNEYDVLNKIEQRTSREINFHHRREVLFSEKVVNHKGLSYLLNLLIHRRENRINTLVVIVKKNVKKLLEADPQMDKYPGERIRETLVMNWLPSLNEQDIYTKISLKGIDPFIPVFDAIKMKKKKQIQFIGIALLSGDKIVGYVPEEDIVPYLWLGSAFKIHKEKVSLSGRNAVINVDTGKKRLKVKRLGNKIQYQLFIDAKGEILLNDTNLDLSRPQNVSLLERQWQIQLTNKLNKAVSELKKKKCDLMGAGLKLHATYPSEWRQIQKNWYEKLAKSEFKIQVNVEIQHFGNITHYAKETP
jgi:spore germination protein KC